MLINPHATLHFVPWPAPLSDVASPVFLSLSSTIIVTNGIEDSDHGGSDQTLPSLVHSKNENIGSEKKVDAPTMPNCLHNKWNYLEKSRREALGVAFLVGFSFFGGSPSEAMASEIDSLRSSALLIPPPAFGVSDAVISSLVFEKILGQGSYKTVYLVSSTTFRGEDNKKMRFALAAERLKGKSNVKDAIRGVRVVEELQQRLQRLQGDFEDDTTRQYFEHVEGWWFQESSLPDFEEYGAVFPRLQYEERTKKPPSRFLGSKWLLALKPVYDMDLKRFAQASPMLYPVSGALSAERKSDVVAGTPLTEESALQLVSNVCRAGGLMHSTGLVHRDIKPKNIMLKNGRPVIIDFGFAHFVDTPEKDGRFCIVQEGRVKGEARYVLAPDVAMSRGCQEGDMYAMGKTLYEVLFGIAPEPSPSGKLAITKAEASEQNAMFRAMLNDRKVAGSKSRFQMSTDARDILLKVIRSLCREDEPITFAEAEEILRTYRGNRDL